ncbi:hypothetical protein [Sinomonas atrocyanea]
MNKYKLLQILLLAVGLIIGITAPVFNGQSILALLIAGSVLHVRPRRPRLTVVK